MSVIHDVRQVAEAMFNAYNETSDRPWLTWDGKPVPRWHELNTSVVDKWIAAAECACEMIEANIHG